MKIKVTHESFKPINLIASGFERILTGMVECPVCFAAVNGDKRWEHLDTHKKKGRA